MFRNELDIPKVITAIKSRFPVNPSDIIEAYQYPGDDCFNTLIDNCAQWAKDKGITKFGQLEEFIQNKRRDVKGTNVPIVPKNNYEKNVGDYKKPKSAWWIFGGKTIKKRKLRTRRVKH
jgi:hypothetical protein